MDIHDKLMQADERTVERIAKEIGIVRLAMVLKSGPPHLCEVLYRKLSDTLAEEVKKEMEAGRAALIEDLKETSEQIETIIQRFRKPADT